jgi:hypothetical protein
MTCFPFLATGQGAGTALLCLNFTQQKTHRAAEGRVGFCTSGTISNANPTKFVRIRHPL